jgi:hypothetical protein
MTLKASTYFQILLYLNTIALSQVPIPSDWKRPADKLFEQKWRNDSKLNYLFLGADLNCDNIIDSVMILESNEDDGIGLFVFLKEPTGRYSTTILYESIKDKANFENLNNTQIEQIKKRFKSAYGIDLVTEGIYKTACGKGYYDCEKDEPNEINIKCKGINFFQYEGANKFYYWDKQHKKFKEIWISD